LARKCAAAGSGEGFAGVDGTQAGCVVGQAVDRGLPVANGALQEAGMVDADSRLRSPLSHALHPWKCVASSRYGADDNIHASNRAVAAGIVVRVDVVAIVAGA
jgi:hypothetical protein